MRDKRGLTALGEPKSLQNVTFSLAHAGGLITDALLRHVDPTVILCLSDAATDWALSAVRIGQPQRFGPFV